MVLVWMLCIPIILLYSFAGKQFVLLFLHTPSELALKTGTIFLRILSPFYLIVSLKLVSDGILRGSDCMKQFIIGTFADLILRVTLSFILSKTSLGSVGIWLSWPFGWTFSTILSLIFYFQKQRVLIPNDNKFNNNLK